MAGFEFYKCRNGNSPDMFDIIAHEAVKKGDAVTPYASNLSQVDRVDDAAEYVLGVAVGDAGAGAKVSCIKVTQDTIFIAPCKSDKKFVQAADSWTTADLVEFTSGAMTIDPATDTSHQVRMISLAPGETNDSNGNKCLIIFALRSEG